MSSGVEANRISDLLFLRLGRNTGASFGDKSAVPELAKSWSRRDSVTLVFDLDPRARWHDGTPVTSRDIVFSFTRARDMKVVPSIAPLLQDITAVEAQGDRRVIIRFARPYGEQLYDATYHVQILPAHLIQSIPAESLASSAYGRAPVGTGPYRWSRLEPAQFLELASVPTFFLGKPVIEQLVWRFTSSQEARFNLLLSGEADVQEDIIPPPSNIARLAERPSLRVGAVSLHGGELPALQRAPAVRHHEAASDLCQCRIAARTDPRARPGHDGAGGRGPLRLGRLIARATCRLVRRHSRPIPRRSTPPRRARS